MIAPLLIPRPSIGVPSVGIGRNVLAGKFENAGIVGHDELNQDQSLWQAQPHLRSQMRKGFQNGSGSVAARINGAAASAGVPTGAGVAVTTAVERFGVTACGKSPGLH